MKEVQALVAKWRASQRSAHNDSSRFEPDQDEHWFYMIEANTWGRAADELERALNGTEED